jgi:hypothetical protein
MTKTEGTTFVQAQMLHKQRQLDHCKNAIVDTINWLDQMIADETSAARIAVYKSRRDKLAFAIGYANS